MKNIAILASGNGTNAENIAKYFANHSFIKVSVMMTGNPKARAIDRMNALGVPCHVFSHEEWNSATSIIDALKSYDIDLIVLSGFMSVLTHEITDAYNGKIINIHPSLLPKFGGKGMWGMNVHKAVIEAHEKESGITIHYVTEQVDGGGIICQKSCPVMPDDTPELLATRIHAIEYDTYPKVIEQVLTCD